MAVPDFEEVIGLRPREAEGYEGRGSTRAKLGQYREAVADAKEALQRAERTPRHLCRIARIYAQAAVAAAQARQPARDTVRLVGNYQDRAASLFFEALTRSPPNQAASIRSQLRTDPVLRPLQHRVWAALERNRPTLSAASPGGQPPK